MTRGVWAKLVICAALGGCTGPQYYKPPPEKMPPAANVNGTAVAIVDQRPDWEKKPFTGVVCLYHLGKAHPDAWAQLAEETNAVVAAMPQKPERVEIDVTSFRLVRSGDTVPRFRDWSANVPAVPAGPAGYQGMTNNRGGRTPTGTQSGVDPGTPTPIGAGADGPPNKVAMAFSSKDDPRRMLQDYPSGASCSIEAKVRLVFPGGREQTVDVKTIAHGANDSGTQYYGEAIDFAARSAIHNYAHQFRSGVGLGDEIKPASSASVSATGYDR
jgi:hypothetical protein